jgi:PiT family inorganic phosphate transporter
MEFSSLAKFEKAGRRGRGESMRMGIGLRFAVGVMLVAVAVIGGYMAMNIGANDVANNVGPAVGSRAISLVGAIALAAVCEMAGALIAGGDVVSTIQKGIIRPDAVQDADRFIWLMTAALLSGALWLNLATAMGAPVSTTHSIVGAVLGAGVAAGGVSAANWDQLGGIAASWVVSPVLGGLIAAGFLYWIKRAITWRVDMVGAARRIVPIMIGLMVWAFATYLALKGLGKVVKIGFMPALGLGAATGLPTRPARDEPIVSWGCTAMAPGAGWRTGLSIRCRLWGSDPG